MKRTHWLSLAIVVVLTLAVIAPAYGQDGSPATSLGEAGRAPAEGGVTLSPAPDCAGGLQNDGGTFENGYSFYRAPVSPAPTLPNTTRCPKRHSS